MHSQRLFSHPDSGEQLDVHAQQDLGCSHYLIVYTMQCNLDLYLVVMLV